MNLFICLFIGERAKRARRYLVMSMESRVYIYIYTYSRRHKKVPVPYSYYDRKTLRSVKLYDPITVQIVITVVLFTP